MTIKRIIAVFAVAVMGCGVANAVNVSWGVGSPDGNGAAINLSLGVNYDMYLVYLGGNNALDAVGPGATFSGGDILIASATAQQLGSANTWEATSAATIADGETYNSLASRYAVVVFRADGKYQAYTTGQYYTDATGTLSADGQALRQWSTDSSENPNGVYGTGTSAWLTPVPEPASMALFGIGAGVIALRRRFKNKKA